MVVAMKKNLFVIVMMFWSSSVLLSQETWVKTFGGSRGDKSTSITTTPDGGYVLTGETNSNDGDFKGMKKGVIDNIIEGDIFVTKLDSRGNIQWKNTFGGSSREMGSSITTTPDGGYVLTGQTYSNEWQYFNDGDFKGMNKGGEDIFVIKLDSGGNVQWKKIFGGSSDDYSLDITTTTDRGYVVTGNTSSDDGDFKGMNKGEEDIFVIKLDSSGNIQWTKIFGGSDTEQGFSIAATPDGGCVLSGVTYSKDGDFKGMNRGDGDVFVIKLDSRGGVQWKKRKRTFGGSGSEGGISITTSPDGGYVLTGQTYSNDGDFKDMNKGLSDVFVLKLDSSGNVQWKKLFGGFSTETGSSITTTPDGGYVLTGVTESYGTDGTEDDGGFERMNYDRVHIIVIKLDSRGDVQWKKKYGGTSREEANSICTSPDGGYTLTGWTYSNDGDFEGMNKRGEDIFVIKLDSNGNLQQKSKK